jgi:hypothetical protein
MSDAVIAAPHSIPRFAEEQRKPISKTQKAQPQFPCRVTFCMAQDQIETLTQARKMYRASDSFMLRLAWDNFVRANNLSPQLNNGGQNVR